MPDTSLRNGGWTEVTRKRHAEKTPVASTDHSDLLGDLQTIVNTCRIHTNNTNGLLQKLQNLVHQYTSEQEPARHVCFDASASKTKDAPPTNGDVKNAPKLAPSKPMHSNTPRIAQNNANTPKERSKEAPVLKRPPKPYKYPWGFGAERRGQVPGWLHELSKKINAALRHSVGCRQDKNTFSGVPCDEGAWVNIENLMKYDHLWKHSYVLDGTDTADWRKVIERWNPFMQVIYTEFRNLHRVRAQILELKATSGELRQVVRVDPRHRILSTINGNKLRIEIGDDDDKVWLWPVAIRVPMDTQSFLVELRSKHGDCHTASTRGWGMFSEEDFTGPILVHWPGCSKKGYDQVEGDRINTFLILSCSLGP